MGYNHLHSLTKGETQKIAIIDSGIKESLISNDTVSYSLVGDDVYDQNGHGTMMYSILKGYEDDVIGISPDSEILAIKVLNQDESIKKEYIYEAINFAIDQKVTIINLSVASQKFDKKIAEAIKTAYKQGITIVSSSGDYSAYEVMFPGNLSEVISVGAIGKNFEILDLTSGGDYTTINAPGEDIITAGANGEIFLSSGTSQATALISGYVALLKDYANKNNVELHNKEIERYLKLVKEGELSYQNIFKLIKSEK